LTESGSRVVQETLLRSSYRKFGPSISHFATTVIRSEDSLSSSQRIDAEDIHHHDFSRHRHAIPQPELAVAYDYDDFEEDFREARSDLDTSDFSLPRASAAGGSRPPSNSGPSPTSLSEGKSPPRKSGGSGGGGRHRCPKCGTYVTFRHGDFDENTFYCAACSGWFVVSPNTITANDKSGYHELLEKQNMIKRSEDPHVLMQHIPENPKIYGSRQQRPGESSNERVTTESEVEEEIIGKTSTRIHEVKRMPTPREIMRGLNEYVIGQRNVKVALSVGVYNHYKRIFVAESQAAADQRKAEAEEGGFISVHNDGPSLADMNLGQYGSSSKEEDAKKPFCEAPDINSITDNDFGRDVEDCEIDKSNIMLLGPTGSGKTLLVKTLARLIDVPLVIADATCLTQAGYVGEDVESILFKLYLESGQDIERCQRGIVYIDEADKVRKSGGNISISRDVSGEGVQHALLKIVEGNVINVPKVRPT